MKTTRIFMLFSLLLSLATVLAQSRQEQLSDYFEAVRTNQFAPVPDIVLSGADPRLMLEHLSRFQVDSSSAVKIKACEMIYRIADKNDDPGIREAAVSLLVSVCAQDSSEVTGVALNYLQTFERRDFAASAREDIKSLLSGDYSHLQELIMVIGFLQLTDVIPQLKTFAGRGSHPSVRWASLTSLARLGDAEATRQMMAHVRRLAINDDVVYNIFPDLVFSRSPEAISYMVNVLHSEANDCLSADAERETAIPCGYRVMEQLAPIIKDFPLECDSGGDLKTADYPGALKQVRQWFLQNKHYVIIDDTY